MITKLIMYALCTNLKCPFKNQKYKCINPKYNLTKNKIMTSKIINNSNSHVCELHKL